MLSIYNRVMHFWRMFKILKCTKKLFIIVRREMSVNLAVKALWFSLSSGGWNTTCRSSEGRVQRAMPGSTASGPAPAARGHWESSGTLAQSAAAAATASATSVVWEQRSGSARSATRTGREATSEPAVQRVEMCDSARLKSSTEWLCVCKARQWLTEGYCNWGSNLTLSLLLCLCTVERARRCAELSNEMVKQSVGDQKMPDQLFDNSMI